MPSFIGDEENDFPDPVFGNIREFFQFIELCYSLLDVIIKLLHVLLIEQIRVLCLLIQSDHITDKTE